MPQKSLAGCPLFALRVDNFSGRDRLATFLPRIVPMNRAVSPSPGPSDRLLPVGEGKSVRPPAAGSWVDRLAAFLPRIVPMNRAVSPSPGPSDRLLPVGEGKSVRPPAAGSWKEWALPGSALGRGAKRIKRKVRWTFLLLRGVRHGRRTPAFEQSQDCEAKKGPS